MAKDNSVLWLTDTENHSFLDIEAGDTTGEQTLFTAGADGSILRTIIASSDDTADMDVVLSINDGATSYIIGVVEVPLGSGTTADLPSVNLLNNTAIPSLQLDNQGNYFLPMKAGYTIEANVLVAVTAAKKIQLTAIGEDY